MFEVSSFVGEVAISGTETLLALIGGVALLLWGTRMVRTGFQRAYGVDLRRAIQASTSNRFLAFFAGIGVTAALQSSTATALIITSFATRSLIATAPALSVMLGADVGTTLVVQVLSFDVGWLSPLLILVGVIAFMAGHRTRQRDIGRVFIGLGLMLLALNLIVGASAPMAETAAVQSVIAAMAHEPFLALLIAGLLTWLAHSSLAMVLLVMSLALTATVPLSLAFALILGANLGGAIPPMIMNLRESAVSQQVPVGNFLFKILGCLAVFPLIEFVAPHVAAFDSDPARQVANFHTAFNLCLAVVFIGVTDTMAALCARLLPSTSTVEDPGTPRYLDPAALKSPAVALTCAAREALRMGDTIESMLLKCGTVLRTDDRKLTAEVVDMDDVVDRLHESIKLFLTEVSKRPLDEAQSRRCFEIFAFTTNLEHIGDIIDKNLMELAAKKIRYRLHFSDAGLNEIEELHRYVLDHLRIGLSVFMSGDVEVARRLIEEKSTFRDLERAASDNHLERLRSGLTATMETSSLHLDVLRDLKRIHSHIVAVAYPILEQAGELLETRLKLVQG